MKGKIPEDHLKTCKLGCGSETCAYLSVGPEGWMCLKASSMRGLIEERLRNGEMGASGDNCDGIDVEESGNDSGKAWN